LEKPEGDTASKGKLQRHNISLQRVSLCGKKVPVSYTLTTSYMTAHHACVHLL